MRILYVSRAFNRSGYLILDHLLRQRRFQIIGVLLPAPPRRAWLDMPGLCHLAEAAYRAQCAYWRCRPVRFLGSIARLARRHGVPVYELPSIKTDDADALLRGLDIDLLALGGGWPGLLPERVITLPRLGAINTHPSLLPDFRGTDIHRWQVWHGVAESGTTIHYIDEHFDTGDILGQARVPITETDTAQDLALKAAQVAGPLMVEVLEAIARAAPARVRGIPQARRLDTALYHHRWPWENEAFLRVDWARGAAELARMIRANCQESYAFAGPWCAVHGRRYLIRMAEPVPGDGVSRAAGEIAAIGAAGVEVRCGDGRHLRLTQIQRDAPRRAWQRGVPAQWLARWEHVRIGDSLAGE